MMKILHYSIATVLGAGYFPKAPGTMGSLVTVIIFWFLPIDEILKIVLLFVVFFAGVLSAAFVEKQEGKDPGKVVVDEFVGQGLTLLFIPHTYIYYLIGFILFRIFDIWKPFPVKNAERLPSGWGIMADDVVAGIYAFIILQVIIYFGIF